MHGRNSLIFSFESRVYGIDKHNPVKTIERYVLCELKKFIVDSLYFVLQNRYNSFIISVYSI